jgi:predicted nucleotidyltransferase
MFTIEELKEKIVETYDPDLLVDVLKVTTEELVEALTDQIQEMADFFEEEFKARCRRLTYGGETVQG